RGHPGCARRGADACRAPRARSGTGAMRAAAAAKINLALVLGPPRADGRHELVTVYQRVVLCDRLTVERAPNVRVDGFDGDTLVREALEAVADGTGLRAHTTKRIPVAAGLGGGRSRAPAPPRPREAPREWTPPAPAPPPT